MLVVRFTGMKYTKKKKKYAKTLYIWGQWEPKALRGKLLLDGRMDGRRVAGRKEREKGGHKGGRVEK